MLEKEGKLTPMCDFSAGSPFDDTEKRCLKSYVYRTPLKEVQWLHHVTLNSIHSSAVVTPTHG